MARSDGAQGLVLYDASCPFCRTLAEFVEKRSGGELAASAWQDYRRSEEAARLWDADVLRQEADRIRVVTEDGNLLEGEAAWEYLLDHYQDLKGVSWLARKAGLSREAARGLQWAGKAVRRVCRRCGRRA